MRVERLNNKPGEAGGVIVVFDENESERTREAVTRLMQYSYEDSERRHEHNVNKVLGLIFRDILKLKSTVHYSNSQYQAALTKVLSIINSAADEYNDPRGMRRDDV